jgi:hypothetical protein
MWIPWNEKQLKRRSDEGHGESARSAFAYNPCRELKDANENLVGNLRGSASSLTILNDTIMVTATIPGGPSEKVACAPATVL